MQKRWKIQSILSDISDEVTLEILVQTLLKTRGIKKNGIEEFFHPPDPRRFTSKDIGIDSVEMNKVVKRIVEAHKRKESVVVYADYDADGITAGTIMWKTLHALKIAVMPYIPHRVEEGYGLSIKGIDAVKEKYNPALIITVDHGITAYEKVAYAHKLGIEVIVTDHHVKPKNLPDCLTVHTTTLCGAGVAWFVAKELLQKMQPEISPQLLDELLELTSIGTIADMVPLTDVNRSIVKHGLDRINNTSRIGLRALISESGVAPGSIDTYAVSHILAPRLNAMGRLEHAMDALRLLCTKQEKKAYGLAQKLGEINRERQNLTLETTLAAKSTLELQFQSKTPSKLLFLADPNYNQGIIGLVAGKLVEAYYRPSIVVAIGETVSRASARSISGFNIIELIRSCSDLLVDSGGHPMAAGFTVETSKLQILKTRLEEMTEERLDENLLERVIHIDAEIPLEAASFNLWKQIQMFAPFGVGNYEPVFATKNVVVQDVHLIGVEGKHLKINIKFQISNFKYQMIEAIGFNMGKLYSQISADKAVDIAYVIDLNRWNGKTSLQLKLKDIHFNS